MPWNLTNHSMGRAKLINNSKKISTQNSSSCDSLSTLLTTWCTHHKNRTHSFISHACWWQDGFFEWKMLSQWVLWEPQMLLKIQIEWQSFSPSWYTHLQKPLFLHNRLRPGSLLQHKAWEFWDAWLQWCEDSSSFQHQALIPINWRILWDWAVPRGRWHA